MQSPQPSDYNKQSAQPRMTQPQGYPAQQSYLQPQNQPHQPHQTQPPPLQPYLPQPQYAVQYIQAPAANPALQVAPQQIQFQPIYVQQAPPTQQMYMQYKWRNSMILGILHVVLGGLCVAFHGGAIGVHAWGNVIGHGIWMGVFFVVNGVFGILASKQKNHCMISTFLGLSITSCIMAAAGAVLAIYGAAYRPDYYYYYNYHENERVAMNAVLAVCFLLELGAAIWSCMISGVVCGGQGTADCSCNKCYGCDECYPTSTPLQVQYTVNGSAGPGLIPTNTNTVTPHGGAVGMANPAYSSATDSPHKGAPRPAATTERQQSMKEERNPPSYSMAI